MLGRRCAVGFADERDRLAVGVEQRAVAPDGNDLCVLAGKLRADPGGVAAPARDPIVWCTGVGHALERHARILHYGPVPVIRRAVLHGPVPGCAEAGANRIVTVVGRTLSPRLLASALVGCLAVPAVLGFAAYACGMRGDGVDALG